MAAKNDSKKTTKTAKAKKGDASPAKNSKKPKAPKAAAPETAKVPEPVSPPPVTVAPPDVNAFFDDPTLSMSGYEAHEALKHVLNSTPKPDDTPLASVLLDGDKLIATDDHTHHTAFLSHPISEGPIKITRASAEALRAMLDGELKSAQQLDAAVTVVWAGLIVRIRGASEPHTFTLDRHDGGGPEPKYLHLAPPALVGLVRVPLEHFRRVAKWKGEGDVQVSLSPEGHQVWFDAMVGATTVCRAVVAATGHNLGIRQPSLPGVSATPKPPPQAPTPPAPGPTEPPAAPAPPSPTVPPLQGLPAGLAWLCVVVPKLAFAKLLRESLDALSPCPPWRVDEDAQQVVLGPVPRGAFLDALTARFDALAVPYTTQPSDAPRVYTLAEGAASEPVRAALPDVVDAEVVEAEAPPFEDPAPDVEGDVLRVPVATWEALDADATERLIAPLEMARVIWIEGEAHYVTEPVTPRVAEALVAVLRELGCVELDGGLRPGGGEVRTFALPKAGA